MSTTGHYTRYINQYPEWSDNCDTMVKHISSGLLRSCESCDAYQDCNYKDSESFREKFCKVQLGYYQVEHNHGNTWSFCHFDSFEYNGNKIPGSRFVMPVYEYEGKKAIQHVLDYMREFPKEKLIDMIIKYRFYNRSYCDYAKYCEVN